MITKYEKANKGKLLVAVLALFVVLAGAAVVFSDSEVNATTQAATQYTSSTDLTSGDGFYINAPVTIDVSSTTGKKFYIAEGTTVTFNGDNSSTIEIYAASAFVSGNVTYDETLKITIKPTASNTSVEVTTNGAITADTNVVQASPTAGMTFADVETAKTTYYADGQTESFNITYNTTSSTGDVVTVTNGSATVNQGSNSIRVGTGTTDVSTAYTITAGQTYPQITGGSDTAGAYVTVTSGVFRNVSTTAPDVGKTYVSSRFDSNNYYLSSEITSAPVTSISSWTATIVGNITQNSNVNAVDNTAPESGDVAPAITVNGTYTINSGSTVNVASISGTGSINLYGNLFSATSSSVAVKVASGAEYSNLTNVTYMGATENEFQFGDTLNSNYTVTTNEYLSTNLTIPAGVTLTIGPNGVLNMNKFSINLYGTLVVEGNGKISGTTGSENINLMRGAEIQNNGVIGYGTSVSVKAGTHTSEGTTVYTGYGSALMQNVSGLSFGLANTTPTNGVAQYTLTVTGDVQAEGASNNYKVTINGARIISDFYIAQDVEVIISGASDLMGSASITVDGGLEVGSELLNMKNGSTITVNGQLSGTVKAETGEYAAGDSYSGSTKTTFKYDNGSSGNIIGAYISGFTITVGTYEFVDENDDSMISQNLYVSGTIVFNAIDPESIGGTQTYGGTITLAGNDSVIIATETTLSLPNGLNVTAPETAPIVVEGTIQYATSNATTNPVTNYQGANYTVTVTTPSRTITGYIVPFETAMENIATADRQTVTVMGELEIDAPVTLAAGQTLNVTNADVTVAEDAELIVEPRATVRGTVDTVLGMLTVKNGATCSAPSSYAVRSTGTDAAGVSYTRYAGIAAAIANAQPGETISIVNPVTGVENLTIPAGVTVTASAGISFSGNLVIEETAKLEMTDNAILTADGLKSKITVNGELNVSEGSVVFTNDTVDNSITSAGTTTLQTSNYTALYNKNNLAINGVMYKNENNATVITNAAAAIAAAAAQDINKQVTVLGDVSEVDVELTVNMIVDATADATFGTISVADGVSISVSAGKLTATVSVQTGAEGSTSASTMTLADASGIVIGAGSYNDNGVKNYTMYVYDNSALTGAVTVASGTAVVGNGSNTTLTVNGEKNTLTVASGATLLVNDGMTLNVGTAGTANSQQPAVVVEGTLTITEGAVAIGYNPGSAVNGNMLVSGTMNVGDDTSTTIAAGSQLTVTGTLAVSTTADHAGLVTVNGTLIVGDKVTTLGANGIVTGAIDTPTTISGANGIVKVYAGSDVSGAQIDVSAGESQAVSTAFYINGNLYMTVYTDATVPIQNVLTAETFKITGYIMTNSNDDAYWFQNEDYTGNADGKNIGDEGFEAVYFHAAADEKTITISVGTGISLYVDGVKITNNTLPLSVGTHTVEATVNPGYTGTVTITFDGQTVTGGSITVTPEMTSPSYADRVVLAATGDISYDTGSTTSNGGMGIVEILLVILVVVVVILAIIVVLRMMRS